MVMYCTCNGDIGYSNRTSVVSDALGDEICAHCGGVVPSEGPYTYDPYRYPDGVESENSDYEHGR